MLKKRGAKKNMALKKTCLKCGTLINYDKKYCSKCLEKNKIEKKQDNKFYDKYYRDKRSTEFYHSKSWLGVREDIKARDTGLCKLCLLNKKIKYMDMVHHIIEVKEDYSKRLDKDNLICLCNSCHEWVHRQYKNVKQKEKVVELLRVGVDLKFLGGHPKTVAPGSFK